MYDGFIYGGPLSVEGGPFSVECGTTVRAGVPASFSPNLVDRTVDSLRD